MINICQDADAWNQRGHEFLDSLVKVGRVVSNFRVAFVIFQKLYTTLLISFSTHKLETFEAVSSS